jgi:hypothetical protein
MMETTKYIRLAALALAGAPLLFGCNAVIARARAASDLQCREDQIEIKEIANLTFRATGCGKEEVYVCTESGSYAMTTCSREPSMAASPSAARSAYATSAFPDAAAGFSFGLDVDQSNELCESAGGAWSARGSFFECSVAPRSIGSPASVALRFCGDVLCGIGISTQPANGENWLDRFRTLRTTLAARYGAPTSEVSELPAYCGQDVIACLENGSALFRTAWHWSTRHAIRLAMGQLGEALVIRISYERPDAQAQPAL